MPRYLGSIASRLVVTITLATSLLWCSGVIYATYASYYELNKAFDGALKLAAQRLLPMAIDEAQGDGDDDAAVLDRLASLKKGYIGYQLRDSHGRLLLHANDAAFAGKVNFSPLGFVTIGEDRLYSTTDPKTQLTITVSENTQYRWNAIIRSAKGMLWSLAVLVPLNILVVWLVVRASMAPLKQLSEEISKRGATNFSPLAFSCRPAELQPIAGAVSTLVDRLRLALNAERAFAAHAAHELRTPIAGALAQTQHMLIGLGEAEARRRAREVETTLKRLARLAEKLLQLSRVEAGFSFGDRDRDMLPILDMVVSDCVNRLQAPDRIRYRRKTDATLVANMDIDAFAVAVGNLIDNAVKHGTPRTPIEIIVEEGGQIRVTNSCDAISAETLAVLTAPFARGSGHSLGSGLGLGIVEKIMAQTGGRLDLLSPALGCRDGFEARLTFVLSNVTFPSAVENMTV